MFIMPWGPGGHEGDDGGGTMEGVMPNNINVGLTTGDVDRDKPP
jgi:hypothetical protein